MKFPVKYSILASVVIALIATETTLRFAFGLGHPVLSQTDPDTGYRFQPNQKLFRFGKKVEYNQYSQRSEPITPEKPKGVLRILMTGDSILNGGNPTDQQDTISELFKSQLSATGHKIQVLNASAGSWGIGNQLGYLRKFGTFGSDAVIVVIATNDLAQPTSTSAIVGHHPAFPIHPPLTAIQDGWVRYAWPKISEILKINTLSADFSQTPSYAESDQQFQQNMQKLETIVKLVRAKKIPIFVMFVPEVYNLVPTSNPPQYKLELMQKLESLQVPIIDIQKAWSSLPKKTVETYFRDGVHPTVLANKSIANLLYKRLCVSNYLQACYESRY